MCVYLSLYTYIYIYIYACIHILHVYIHVCMCIYIYIHIIYRTGQQASGETAKSRGHERRRVATRRCLLVPAGLQGLLHGPAPSTTRCSTREQYNDNNNNSSNNSNNNNSSSSSSSNCFRPRVLLSFLRGLDYIGKINRCSCAGFRRVYVSDLGVLYY